MQLTVAHIGPKSGSGSGKSLKSHYDALAGLYLGRIRPYFPCRPEAFSTESAFLEWLRNPRSAASRGRAIVPVLLDSRGRQLGSTEFAGWLGARRDQAVSHIAFAIGPAGGWSPAAIEAAQSGILLSFGPMTLAHDLARLVLAEQIYRACTILAGHPYHLGH